MSLDLALFVYTVGLAAGREFFRDLRRRLPLIGGAGVILGAAALSTVALGRLLGISSAMGAGIFSRALTSTPALAATPRPPGGARSPPSTTRWRAPSA